MNLPLRLIPSGAVRHLSGLALIALLGAPVASAQDRAPAPVPTPGEVESEADRPGLEEELISLSPFVVDAQQDRGYHATSTLSGTRIRTNLADVAASIQVVTKEMLRDTASSNSADLLVYTTNTEVGGIGGNYSATYTTSEGYTVESSNFRQPGARVRGLAAPDLTRDYFPTGVPFDAYNTERVEINRGANSALFGLGSPSGILNNTLIGAQNRTFGSIGLQVGQFGSHRETFDLNVAPKGQDFAVRVAGVYDQREFEQKPAYSTDRRAFGTAKWDPKFVRRGVISGFTVRANYEAGRRRSRAPRTLPPVDVISRWFELGKPTWNASTDSLATSNRQIYGHNLTYTLGTFWPDPNSGTNGLGMVGIVQNARPPSLATGQPIMATFAAVARLDTALDLANGNPFTIEKMLMDERVFDFRKHLIDGPNKREFQEFDVTNVVAEARLFGDRLGLEFGYNTEHTQEGGFDWYRNANNDSALHIDINEKLYDGSANPNFGRPYTVSKGYVDFIDTHRTMRRGTAYYKFDFDEVVGPRLGSWLGEHVLTVAAIDQQRHSFTNSGFAYLSDDRLELFQGNIDVWSINNGVSPIVSYLGPSVLNAQSLADVRISPVTVEQRPDLISAANSRYLVWNPATSRWETQAIHVMRQDPEDIEFPGSAARSRQEIDSAVAVLQSKVIKDAVVVTTSWREDRVKNFRSSGTYVNGPRGGLLDDEVNLPILPTPITEAKADAISYGVVARLPREMAGRWRYLSPFSVFLNTSENFQPGGTRVNAYGDPIAPQSGDTKDYGFTFTMPDGKLDFRVTWYETRQTSVSAGLDGVIHALAGMEARVLSRIAGGIRASDIQSLSPGVTQATIDDQIARWQANPWQHTGLYRVRLSSPGSTEYVYTAPSSSVNDTYDYESKGVEFETVANPLPNWRIAVNVSKQEAKQVNTGTTTLNFINERMALWQSTPDLPTTPSLSANVRIDSRNLLASYYRVAARDGSVLPEVIKWRFNLMTNYTVANGMFKGVGFGGAYRWQDRAGAGYPSYYDPSLGIYRIRADQPLYAPASDRIDAWVSYERRLRKGLNWRLQLNVRNVADSDALVPLYRNPDGSVASVRVPEGRRWELSSRFDF